MNLRPISSICSRIQRSCAYSASFYRITGHSFSSNVDNEKNNIVPRPPATTPTTNHLNKFQQSIQDKLKKMDIDIDLTTPSSSRSFWSWIAADEEHRKWIQRYNDTAWSAATVDDDQAFEWSQFSSVWSLTQFIACNAIGGMQRVRMRALKRHLICYEEFMLGSLAAFKSIQHLNDTDQQQIAQCFTPNLYSEVRELKQALFSCDGNSEAEELEYDMVRVQPFANQLFFTDKELPDLDMHFVVRYYYTLKKGEASMYRYADVEWSACWKPIFADEQQMELECMQLKENGFLIRNIDVHQC